MSLVHPTCLLGPGAGLDTWGKKSAESLVGRDWPVLRSTWTPANRSSRIPLQLFGQGYGLQRWHFASAMYFTNQASWPKGLLLSCCTRLPATAHGVGEINAKDWTPRTSVISDIRFIYCTNTRLHPQNTAASLARPNVYILPTIKKKKKVKLGHLDKDLSTPGARQKLKTADTSLRSPTAAGTASFAQTKDTCGRHDRGVAPPIAGNPRNARRTFNDVTIRVRKRTYSEAMSNLTTGGTSRLSSCGEPTAAMRRRDGP